MSISVKSSLPSFSYIFRIIIAAIFVLGVLPAPVLAAGNGNFAGQVTDSSTTDPIEGVQIYVFSEGSQEPTDNTVSDGSGNYTISVAEGSNYQLSARKEGYITGQATGQSITANTTTTVNFSLTPGGVIRGVVTDNVSSPVQNANVRAFLPASPETFYTSMPTDAQGQYSLTAPAAAGYTVVVEAAGYTSANQTGLTATLGTPNDVNFTLQAPQQEQQPPEDTTPPAAITNLVADNPSPNSITLTWTAPGDDGSTGQASQYEIRYATFSITDNATWNNAQIASGVPTPAGAGSTETFTVPNLTDNTTYSFAIKTKDDANLWSDLSNNPSATTQPQEQQQPPPEDTTPPAAITNLTSSNTTYNSVTLTWTAPGDDGSTGQASLYEIRVALSAITDNTTWDSAQSVANGPTPASAGTTETFIVPVPTDNTTYYFAIKTKDDADLWSGLSNSPAATTPVAPPTPTFTIAHQQGTSSFMLAAGANITETFIVNSVNSFEGTINLNFGGPPLIENNSGVTPAQVTLTAGQTVSVSLTIGAGDMMPSGTYQCGLGGDTTAYGGQQKGAFFTVIIGVPGQPLVSASPMMIAAGGQTTFTASNFPQSANITLSWDSGPNEGQTIATGQTTESGTWSTQVTIPEETPGGNFAVRAASGEASAFCGLTITTGEGEDFIMSTSPQFVSLMPGQSANITIYITSINGFSAAVALTTASAPGITCSLSASSVTPASGDTASSVLAITALEWVSPEMYNVNVEGICADPAVEKLANVNVDVQPPAEWGPGISLSQSYAQVGDTITFTGANFPAPCNGETVTIIEATANVTLQTNPATITVNNGSFSGTFIIPSGIPSGNYRIKAIVLSQDVFAERDFQILGTGETFTLSVSPASVFVTTEAEANSVSTSVNIASVGGSSPTVNLAMDWAPSWLTYKFGSLPDNTAASGGNAIAVSAGGSSSRNLLLTADLSAPTGVYSITIKAWVTDGPEQYVPIEIDVQPPAGFGMTQLTLSPTFGEVGRTINFSGTGFTDCSPSQVTELKIGPVDLLTAQSLPTITVPTTGDSAGRLSGSFRVPSLNPGTYWVNLIVGTGSSQKEITKSFTVTGGGETFVLQASPSFLWAEQGSQINTMIKVVAVGSTSPTVDLSLEGLPADITANFTSAQLTAPPGGVASTDLALSISNWMPTGHYTITVKAQKSGSAELHRIPIEIDIAPPAGMGIASIYVSPTVGSPGTWITISGSGFPTSTALSHLFFGQPNEANDQVVNGTLPSISTDGNGAFTAVFQVPAGLTPGMYPVEAVVGNPPAEKRAMADFTVFSDEASFNINLSPNMVQTAPGTVVGTTVNVQSVGDSSADVTLTVEGPLMIQWRFDNGDWGTGQTVTPPIGSTLMSALDIQPKASTPMGHYSLAVKAVSGDQTEIRNLELDVGASSDYGMPIFSINPKTGTAGTAISFSGSNFPQSAAVLEIHFGGDNVTLSQQITTSPQGAFSGSFTVPATVGGQTLSPGSYMVSVTVAPDVNADTSFMVYGSDDTFTISLSPNFLQGEPGGMPATSGILKALGGASPTVKMAVRGLPPGVQAKWNGTIQNIFPLSAPPGGQNNFDLTLVLPNMLAMGHYPATLEGWVDSNSNDAWDEGEDISRIALELAIMPPEGYNMGMLSLTPTYGEIGDTITFAGSGFPADTAVTSLTFAETDVLSQAITTADDGSFSGVFTVPATAFGMDTGPGVYPVDVVIGDRMGTFEFAVTASGQKFSVSASPGWLALPAGDTAYVNINIRSLVSNPPSPTVILRVEGLPRGITPSFTTANVTPPVGDMESRELQLVISNSTPTGNYPISVRAYNAATPSEEMWADFTLEVTPSNDYMDMGMATISLSQNFGTAGDQITVSGYGFPKSQNLTSILLGPTDVTPSVAITTDTSGAFSAVITVPSLPSGPHPVEVNVQNTIRSVQFDYMSNQDTFSLKVSPNWLEPVPAGDVNGREIAITVTALPGKTPTVNLNIEGLFAAFGTIEEVWNPVSKTVNITNTGGSAAATVVLKPSESIPPGNYPFVIVATDGLSNRHEFYMELNVGSPSSYSDSMMGMDQSTWDEQWQGTEWESGVYYPEIMLSPNSGPAGTQVTYTGTSLPAGANVTSINFAGNSVPIPSSGIIADASGGFSGSFIVDESWNLPAGGMYWVDFSMETATWWQNIGHDFHLMRSDSAFTLEATPNWLPPIPPDSFGQTQINVKAMGYTSSNVTLAVMENLNGWGIPGGAEAHWNTTDGPAVTIATVPKNGKTSKTFYLKGAEPGHYMITIVGWIDSNDNQVLDYAVASEADSQFMVPLDFDVEPPDDYMSWDKDTMMEDMGMAADDMYLFYFPEIVLNPNMGQAGSKITINATDFPAEATITHLRFAGQELPVPSGTAANSNGDFTLVFNVPKTMWGSTIGSGWYDVEVEAQKSGEPSVFIVKPFQVTAADVAFTLKADPDWLPPITPGGSASTLIRAKSMGSAANITLTMDKIPAGVDSAFSSTQINLSPGGTNSVTLTLTPNDIPTGHYFAEIKGTANISGVVKIFYAHLEFDVEPPQDYMTWDKDTMMQDMGMAADDMYLFYFPEIVLNPNMGQAGKKVTIKATDFPAGANVTHLRFAGMELPVPAGTAADNNGDFTLIFNVPKTIWGGSIGSGWYDVEVEAQKSGEPSLFIMKPFQVTASDVAFTMRADPDWLPPIAPGSSASTNILLNSTGAGADVTLTVDKIPEGVTTGFTPSSVVTLSPGGSSSATLTLTPVNIPSGHYGAEIKGTATVNGVEKIFYTHVEFEVEPPQDFMTWDRDTMMQDMGMAADDMYLFYFPEIVLNPNMGQAGKKVTIKATDFPTGANVTHLRFAGMELPVPAGTAADVNGDFTLIFNVPKTIWGGSIGSGWYDVEVEAQKTGEPSLYIVKPFQVTASDVAFTMKADPDWLPPIPPAGSSTTIRINSTGAAANVTLTVDKIPQGINTAFSDTVVSVSPGGTATSLLTLTPTSIPSGHYGAEIKGTATISGVVKTFYAHLEFDVEPPQDFMTWDRDTMMQDMGLAADDMYLFYFPEIVLNPNMGQAGKKVTIKATDFPAGANVTHLRFAGMELPVPAGTAADNDGDFNLIFNVPKTIWGGNIGSGWYDVEVEAQKSGEPSVFIMKPFQVTAADLSFTVKAEPDWLPPIPPAGSSTTIRVTSMGVAANVTLSVDKIPSGINTAFSDTVVSVSPGGTATSLLTLTPTTIPSGHYSAEVKGTATISGLVKTFYTHIEFDVEPATIFTDVTWMEQQGIWFPEITINPMAGPAKTKVTVKATDFPAGAVITHLRFAGRELPVPDNTTADSEGNANLVFNVPGDFGLGQYMIEVEAEKQGMSPVFIAKPFFIEDSGVTFNLDVVPGFIPNVTQGNSGETTIFVKSTGQAVNVQLYVDGLPPGVTGTFDSSTVNVTPGGSTSTKLTITTGAATPPGQYPLTIRGVSGDEQRMMPFGLGVTPPASFQMPEFNLDPDYAPAGYTDKKYKITFSGTGFPANKSVSSLEFGDQQIALPTNLTTDAGGNFNGVFQMPTGLTPGTYDVRVAVADGSGGYIYDSRPFSVRGVQAKFILKLSPPYLPPVVQGGQGSITVNVQSVGSTAANVTLSVDGLVPGISAAFTPSNTVAVSPGGSATATLTLTVSTGTPPGSSSINVRGISDGESVTVPLGFSVMPDIGGGEGHATITINPAQARPGEHIGISGAGFTSNSTITLTAAPPGAAVPMNITPGTITVSQDGTWATEITVPEAGQVPPGTYVIKASDGSKAAKNPFSIVPTTGGDFFLNLSPQYIEVVQSQSGNTTMKLTSKNGFKEPVVFSVGHLAPGVTATFKNANGTTISQFTGAPAGIREIVAPIEQTPVPGEDMVIQVLIDVDADTPIGPYDVALEAGSGTVFRAIPLAFMVTSPGASVALAPQGGPVDTDITLSGSGFTAGETITVTFGVSAITTVPATITVAQDGTFTAVITTPSLNAGIYPVRVTGDTSGIVIDRPFGLKPSAVNSFVLYTSPMKVDVPKGGSGTIKAKIEPLGTFQSAVTLSVTGLNAVTGATVNITPSATITPSIATTTTAKLTITVPADADVGKYSLVITGTSGSIIQTRNVTLNVVPPADTPDFGISLAPNTVAFSPASSGNTTVLITSINDFAGAVTLTVAMADSNATWPNSIQYTAGSVTPSATTGLGRKAVVFTASADAQPGSWTFRVTGTSGAISHTADVQVICTPSGTTVTEFASPRLDPTTVTSSTPIDMEPPWGDRITINGIINEGSEASIITPSKVDVAPNEVADLPEGATDMLGRITNVDSSSPVEGVDWNIGFPFDPAALENAGLDEENLKVAYLDPETGEWQEVTTVVDTSANIAYAQPTHFSSWTLLATTNPPPSEVVTESPVSGGGGGGGGASGVTSLAEYLTGSGEFTATATAQSVDMNVKVTIAKGTIGKNKAGGKLYAISIKDQPSPAAPPINTTIIGSVYDIGPNGSSFDPPIDLTFKYKDTQIPTGVDENDLVLATYENGQWTKLPDSTVDPTNNTITVKVSHFSYYTILASTKPASFDVSQLAVSGDTIELNDSIDITTTVSNDGDIAGTYTTTLKVNGDIADTREVVLEGHSSVEVKFTLTPEVPGIYYLDVDGLTATVIVNKSAAQPKEETVPEELPAEVPEEVPADVTAATGEPEEAPAAPAEEFVPAEEPEEIPAAETPEEPAAEEVLETSEGISDIILFVLVAAAGVVVLLAVFLLTRRRKVTS